MASPSKRRGEHRSAQELAGAAENDQVDPRWELVQIVDEHGQQLGRVVVGEAHRHFAGSQNR